MNYYINTGCWGALFAVPQDVVDNYIKLANEAAIKVLLYVLRNSNRKVSTEEISEALAIDSDNIEESFLFWEQANILLKSKDNFDSNKIQSEKDITNNKVKPDKTKERKPGYNLTPAEISKRIEESDDIKVLFSMAESTFGRFLNHTEQREFIWMHDYLGLSTDVLLMLSAYCVSIEKGNIRYIETIAVDWNEKEINTLEAAQAEIKRLEESNSFNYKIIKLFGISNKLTTKQKQFVQVWKEKGYSEELIEYAYEKTIEAINKLNFPYINKILENWYENGLLTKAKVDESTGYVKSSSNKSEEHSYDLNDYKSLVNNFGER